MKFGVIFAVTAVAAVLSGCAGLSRMTEYGSRLADAKTTVDGHSFSLWVHPRENAILVQRGFGGAMGQSLASGATLGAVNMMEPKPYWTKAAQWLTDPLGCTVTDAYSLDNKITWEAPFTCPESIDLRAKVMQQRDSLREGAPLKP